MYNLQQKQQSGNIIQLAVSASGGEKMFARLLWDFFPRGDRWDTKKD